MALLNTNLGETSSAMTPDTGTIVPGSGKGLRQGLRGLQQRRFKIGVKRGGMGLGKPSSYKKLIGKVGGKSAFKSSSN